MDRFVIRIPSSWCYNVLALFYGKVPLELDTTLECEWDAYIPFLAFYLFLIGIYSICVFAGASLQWCSTKRTSDRESFRSPTPVSGEMFFRASVIYCQEVMQKRNMDSHIVSQLSLVEMAEYADPVAQDNVDQPWIRKSLDTLPLAINADYNATALGNAAYVLLHTKFGADRPKWLSQLKVMCDKIQSRTT